MILDTFGHVKAARFYLNLYLKEGRHDWAARTQEHMDGLIKSETDYWHGFRENA